MAPRQHRPSPHLACLAADAAEIMYDAAELHAGACLHPYPEYPAWHQHGLKAKGETDLILVKHAYPLETTPLSRGMVSVPWAFLWDWPFQPMTLASLLPTMLQPWGSSQRGKCSVTQIHGTRAKERSENQYTA